MGSWILRIGLLSAPTAQGKRIAMQKVCKSKATRVSKKPLYGLCVRGATK